MSAKVRVTINGRTVEVPAGTLVTDAARAAGVHIPVFCSHAKLPPLGACRICLVEIGLPRKDRDGKPVLGADGAPEIAWNPKPQTGCTTPVSEGMVVATDSPVAVRARKGVMEFLLVNHPLDCPVCDEGGECQLQDLAFAFGADFSRMNDAKRTFVSVITLISVLGVALGVAVLIIVISVMSGFDHDLREKILGFNAHLTVTKSGETMKDYAAVAKVVSQNKNVRGVSPFVFGPEPGKRFFRAIRIAESSGIASPREANSAS